MSCRALCPHCYPPDAPTFEADTPQDAARAVYEHIREFHPLDFQRIAHRATAAHQPVRTYQSTITGGLRVISPSRLRMREPRPTRKGNQYTWKR